MPNCVLVCLTIIQVPHSYQSVSYCSILACKNLSIISIYVFIDSLYLSETASMKNGLHGFVHFLFAMHSGCNKFGKFLIYFLPCGEYLQVTGAVNFLEGEKNVCQLFLLFFQLQFSYNWHLYCFQYLSTMESAFSLKIVISTFLNSQLLSQLRT